MNAPRTRFHFAAAMIVACFVAFAPAGARAQAAADYAALLAAPDRSDADRQADKRRDPTPFVAFAGPHPGMKVLDMGAGGGYSSELMARAVAPNGVVFAQNPSDLADRAKTAFEARRATPAMKNVVADTAPFDDPVPAGMQDFDLITFLFYYHDTTYMTVDRAQMNRKLFAALKPGRYLVIADHSALPGQGASPSAIRCIGSRKAPCARKSKPPASSWSARAISGATPTTRTISRASSATCRSTISCSNFRSRCEAAIVIEMAGINSAMTDLVHSVVRFT